MCIKWLVKSVGRFSMSPLSHKRVFLCSSVVSSLHGTEVDSGGYYIRIWVSCDFAHSNLVWKCKMRNLYAIPSVGN